MKTRTLGNRYELTELIAKGGMGTVHAARDTRLDRDVAVKLLKDELAQDSRFIERFRREARSAAGLSHGNVARVFDYGEDDGCHFIVMELASGSDLARLLREEGALEPGRARVIAAQIAAALGHAHDMDLIHRDVKPANVIVDDADGVKVTDFGIARASGESTLTATGSVLGTAQYLAPEQASGEGVTSATDVYALGIVLYEMLTGSLPFTGASAVEVAMRHLNDEVPRPSALARDVPPELDEIVARATAKDPARRFADGNELAAALGGEVARPTLPLTPRQATKVLPVAAAADPWDARRLGRTILLVFVALAAVAALLALIRIATAPTADETEAPGGDRGGNAEEAPPAEAPAVYTIPIDVVGMRYQDVEGEIERTGLDIAITREERDAFEDKHIILDSNPPPGSEVPSGGAITLFVSSGNAPDDDDDDDDDDRSGRGNGRDRGRGRGSDDD